MSLFTSPIDAVLPLQVESSAAILRGDGPTAAAAAAAAVLSPSLASPSGAKSIGLNLATVTHVGRLVSRHDALAGESDDAVRGGGDGSLNTTFGVPTTVRRPVMADPTSSYQPAHISASLGGAPNLTTMTLGRRGGGHSGHSSSSLPVLRAPYVTPSLGGVAHGEPRALLLRPYRPGITSTWPSAFEASSDEGMHSSLPSSLPHAWPPAVLSAAPLSRQRSSTLLATSAGPNPLVVPGAAAVGAREGSVQALADPFTAQTGVVLAEGVNSCPISPPNGEDEDSDMVMHEPEAIFTEVPLFASPFRRAQIVERKRAEELASLTRQRVLEYLDGQVPPPISSTGASLGFSSSSSPITPFPQPAPAVGQYAPHHHHQQQQQQQHPHSQRLHAHRHGVEGEVIKVLADPSISIDGSPFAMETPFLPVTQPTHTHTHVANGVASGAVSPAAMPADVTFAAINASADLADRPAAQARCPLCHDLVTFCPHGAGGLLLDLQEQHSPPRSPDAVPLLHAQQIRGSSSEAAAAGGGDAQGRRRRTLIVTTDVDAMAGGAAAVKKAQRTTRLLVPILSGQAHPEDEEQEHIE